MKPCHLLLTGLLFAAVSCKSEKSPQAAGSADTAAEVAADGSVILAKKDDFPAAGSILTKVATMTVKDASLKVKAAGQEMDGKMNQTKDATTKDEVIAPSKMRRIVESEAGSGTMTMNGGDQKTPEKPNPLVGIPVICEKKDGTWTATLESGTPSGEQAEALDNIVLELSAESAFHMYGEGIARKPGDEWKVDPSQIGFSGGKDLAGDYSVKFLEIKEHEGVQCAVLKATFNFTGKTRDGSGGPEMSLRMKGEATSYRSIADRVDLLVELDGTMTVSGSPAPNVSMEMEGPVKMVQKSTVKRP